MKKIIYSFMITVIVCFSLISVILSFNFKSEKSSARSNIEYYKISIYMNKLAIYKNDDSKPSKIYDIYIDNLPGEDKKALQKGIIVKNQHDLQSIIEDYTS